MRSNNPNPHYIPPSVAACKRRLLVAEAERWVGVREQGFHRGQIVELFQAWNDKVDHVAWCMAFAQYCLKRTDWLYDRLVARSTRPRHRIFPTEHVMTAWDRTPKQHRRRDPAPGLIAVWQRYRDDEPILSGHTGIVIEAPTDADTFITVEGNTTVPLSGGFVKGVGRKSRRLRGMGSLRLRGFLDPYEGL